MIKFTQLMTFGIGDKFVSFNGRESFPVEDDDLKQGLLALGVFTEQENGELVYSGKVTVPLADKTEVEVDLRGFIPIQKADLAAEDTEAFA